MRAWGIELVGGPADGETLVFTEYRNVYHWQGHRYCADRSSIIEWDESCGMSAIYKMRYEPED